MRRFLKYTLLICLCISCTPFYYALFQFNQTSNQEFQNDLLQLVGITLSNQENSPQSILVSSLSKGFTTKNSGTDSFTVTLSRTPNDVVNIPLSASISGQVAINPNNLTFSPTNWNIPQTVTVTGLDDLAALGTFVNLVINLGPSQSQDTGSASLTASTQTFSNRDYRRIIFSTTINTHVGGSLGGVAGADSLCNSDSGKPINTGAYKAMIATGTIRRASLSANLGDGQIDWVFLPNQLYVRPSGLTVITTNANGIFVFGTLTNSIGTSVNLTWTGLNENWTTAGGCGTNWNDTGVFGRYGNDDRVDFTVLNGGNTICSSPGRLVCVQQ